MIINIIYYLWDAPIENEYFFQPSWIMMVIVFSIMIIGFLYSSFPTRFTLVIRSVLNARFTSKLVHEDYSLTHMLSLLLAANFLICGALFLQQFLSFFQLLGVPAEPSFTLFMLLIALLLLVYSVKIIAIHFFGALFKKPELSNSYIFTLFLLNQVVGVFLLPAIIFIAYGGEPISEIFIWGGAVLFAISFILRIGKGLITIWSTQGLNPFYIFLYLCTLEILPLIIGYKLLERAG